MNKSIWCIVYLISHASQKHINTHTQNIQHELPSKGIISNIICSRFVQSQRHGNDVKWYHVLGCQRKCVNHPFTRHYDDNDVAWSLKSRLIDHNTIWLWNFRKSSHIKGLKISDIVQRTLYSWYVHCLMDLT